MQKKYLSGFSLIELMIVVTIIGVLAALAIPSYQDYVKRARFAEVLAATAPFKTAIALALQQGAEPAELHNGSHGIPAKFSTTKNVASIQVENGVITATATPIINSVTLVLSPNKDGSVWSMSGTCVKAGLCSS